MSKNSITTSSFPTFARVGSSLVRMRLSLPSVANRSVLMLIASSILLIALNCTFGWGSRRSGMSSLDHELMNRGVMVGILDSGSGPRIHFQLFPPAVRLSPARPERRLIKLNNCNRLDQETWSLISQLAFVCFIDLSDTTFNANEMASLKSHAGLNELILSRSNVDDDALQILASFTPRITKLALDDTAVTDASVKTLIQSFQNLKTLEISCPNITAEGLKELRQGRPTLVIVLPIAKPTVELK